MAGPGAHSMIGGSVCKQYMACPGSVAMRSKFPSVSSEAADEGTRLHALMEHCLRNGEWDAGDYVGAWLENEEQIPLGGGFHAASAVPAFTKDQCDAVSTILRYVWALMRSPTAELYVETNFALADIDPRAFGTADIVIVDGETLHLVDAKFGKGVLVEVENNAQLQFYAAGARRKIESAANVFRITLTIAQPRAFHPAGPIRTWETDIVSLMEWESELAAAIKRTDDPKAPLVAGDHCQFCPGARLAANGKYPCAAFEARTNAARDAAFDLSADMTAVDTMDAATLGRRYSELAILKKYIRDMESLAKRRARVEVPEGYEWAKGGRDWKWNAGESDVFQFIQIMHGDAAAREIIKLVTPIQAEKALPDAVFADMADMIDKSEAAPQLVKKGARKNTLSLAEVQAHFAKNRDDAFDEID